MAERTKGKWKVRDGGRVIDVAGPNGEFLAPMKIRKESEHTMRPTREEALANAYAMAAAPRMIRALESIRSAACKTHIEFSTREDQCVGCLAHEALSFTQGPKVYPLCPLCHGTRYELEWTWHFGVENWVCSRCIAKSEDRS